MPDELVRRAKILAAQRDTSVSGLVARLLEQLVGDVRDYDDVAVEAQRDTSVSGLVARLLEQLVGDVRDYDDVAVEERRLMKEGIGLRVGEITWSRDEVHEH
ncbi:hypothetical protein [Mycobacterium riyadhense]|uniref:hypothetical protein n=1 Tax=Mycobacterium riyadhense TaxID=486698 RepID=UPI0021F2BC3F|nr:hypothetical protein [Mycobacterium riyadhense]